jgi:Ca-activated chloride channel family protein
LQKITELTDGQSFHAGSLAELNGVYTTLQQQIGYQSLQGDASEGWLRLGAVVLAAAVVAGVLINRRLPG